MFNIYALLGQAFKLIRFIPSKENLSGARKTSVRLDLATIEFLEQVQSQMGLNSLNDVISLTLNAVKDNSILPASTVLNSSCERLFFLFESHNIPSLHLQGITESVTGERLPILAFNNPTSFSSYLSPKLLQKFADFFGVQPGYFEGHTGPYLISPIVLPDQLQLADLINEAYLAELQPNSALIGVTDNHKKDITIYLQFSYSIDLHKIIKTYRPIGRLFQSSTENPLSSQLKKNIANTKIRAFLFVCDPNKLAGYHRGDLIDFNVGIPSGLLQDIL